MTQAVFDDIAAGLRDSIALADGKADPAEFRVHVPAEIDVGSIRRKLRMTQAEFAHAFGLTVSTVRDWEQRRTRPEGAARAYLRLIERDHETVRKLLAAPEAA